MRLFACLAAALIAASCGEVPQTTRGSVYEVTDETVTIRGQFQSGQTARPTEAMTAQAEDVCPGAKYLSANPSPTDVYTFLYLFRCP